MSIFAAPSFYSQADQNIFNQGNRFITQQPYRLGDPTPMSTGTGGAATATGINTLPMNMGGGGGDGGFNPYDPDMSRVRTDFRPNYEFRQFQDFGNLTSDQLTTAQNKEMDMYSDYYRGPPKSGLSEFASKAINFVPFIGTAKRIAEFFSDKIPINQRAILENQLRGQGVLTDDIGRIVAQPGEYNTPEGIMAGYNAAKMTDATFDKRTGNIAETIKNKYNVDISKLSDEELENFDPNSPAFNLVNRINLINQAKQNFIAQQNKAAEIAAFQEKQRQEKKQAAALKRAEKEIAAKGYQDYGSGGASEATQRSYEGSDGSYAGASTEDYGGGEKDGGFIDGTNRRTDYMMGGLANLVDIYD